jgi:uncharacterized protein (DUF2126 family)
MNSLVFKDVELLPINDQARARLEELAHQYARHSRIYFKVLEVDVSSQVVTLRVVQKRNEQNAYLDNKALIQRSKELLEDELPMGYRIHSRAISYQEGGMG